MIILMVALGGAIGSVVRYSVTLLCSAYLGLTFPYGTLIVNVVGSFLIGLVIAFFEVQIQIPPYWKAGAVAGFLGGLTTFSSFSFDTFALLEQHAYAKAGLNVLSNMVLGLMAVFAGYYAMK